MFIGQGGPLSFTINWPAIISMKIINCNSWVPRDIKWAPGVPVPFTVPPIANNNNLYYSLYVYDNDGGLAIFYYRLEAVIYHFLNKDGYFNEDG